jgi:hypothetical protein
MALVIDGDGNIIMGPRIGMVSHLIAAGAIRLERGPRRFPPREGQQLVAVKIGEHVERQQADVAHWVTDIESFQLLKAWHGLRVWLEIPNAALFTATRKPLALPLDDAPTEVPPATTRLEAAR